MCNIIDFLFYLELRCFCCFKIALNVLLLVWLDQSHSSDLGGITCNSAAGTLEIVREFLKGRMGNSDKTQSKTDLPETRQRMQTCSVERSGPPDQLYGLSPPITCSTRYRRTWKIR